IVRPDDVERDTVIKRADYAAAGIPEYWIMHPAEGTISVLRLVGDTYVVHGVFHRDDIATSSLLRGFCVTQNEELGKEAVPAFVEKRLLVFAGQRSQV